MPAASLNLAASEVERLAMTDLEIFAIGPDALPRVRSLAYEIWPEAYGGILAPERIPGMLAEIYGLGTLRADIDERGHRYWLAAVRGSDAGFVSAYSEGARVWIKKLYVRHERRGLGVGTRMMAAAVSAFPGACSIGLNVNEANAPAIRFYEAQGFRVEGRVPVRMGPYDFTDLVMSRPLVPAD
jgi:ribosomal protein S18 acetylase RimI-like enzyme